jgi:hypothetical protein
MPKTNRWHPCLLPDDYIRRMKQTLAEADAVVESKTRRECVLDVRPMTTDRPASGRILTTETPKYE